MFFLASIALPFFVSVLSGVAVFSAPVASQDPGRSVCTGANGSGQCFLLFNDLCFNIADGNAGSLVGSLDNCFGFPQPNCGFNIDQGVADLTLGRADNLVPQGQLSVRCESF
ncbi:hypothetical protein B0H19DRAFT_1240751 [Mycena capillaripes]|nr:hypothetical protein B0H19DRAFT_1240751 [Mycena capillaripes]